MVRRFAAVVAVFLMASACADAVPGTSRSAPGTTVTTSTARTSTAPAAVAQPFSVSVNDMITQLNLQLPILIEDEATTPLPQAIRPDGRFGGQVTASTEIYLVPQGNAFEPVAAVTVRKQGSGGTFSTPARLLSGVGASLYSLSVEAVDAFSADALPQLGALADTRTTITVGTFYDLTIVVASPTELAFTFTPVGVPAAG